MRLGLKSTVIKGIFSIVPFGLDSIFNNLFYIKINIEFNYNQIKEIDYLLKDININNKEFNTTIKYNIDIPTSFLETIKINNITYQILKEINIEK